MVVSCPESGIEGGQQGAERSGAPGLVNSTTSQTRNPEFKIDRHLARLGRMRRAVVTASRRLLEQVQVGGWRYYAAMITLTYAPGSDWNPKDVSAFVDRIRKHLARRGHPMFFVWVIELQARGTPHYHLIIWLREGVKLPKPDSKGWWSLGSTRIERARNGSGYLAKYTSKGTDSSMFPGGCRLYGIGGLDQESKRQHRYWTAPCWVRERFGPDADVHRAECGGWVDWVTGEWDQSPWVVEFRGGAVWVRLRDSGALPQTGRLGDRAGAHRGVQ
jgi:hypothetical protein